MSSLIIANNAPFGAMTNQSISRLIGLNATLTRLQAAIATASSGFEGTPGTQFEGSLGFPTNNFGVQPVPNVPGEAGSSYRFAVDNLVATWGDFWTAAEAFIAALDNGGPTL